MEDIREHKCIVARLLVHILLCICTDIYIAVHMYVYSNVLFPVFPIDPSVADVFPLVPHVCRYCSQCVPHHWKMVVNKSPIISPGEERQRHRISPDMCMWL